MLTCAVCRRAGSILDCRSTADCSESQKKKKKMSTVHYTQRTVWLPLISMVTAVFASLVTAVVASHKHGYGSCCLSLPVRLKSPSHWAPLWAVTVGGRLYSSHLGQFSSVLTSSFRQPENKQKCQNKRYDEQVKLERKYEMAVQVGFKKQKI